VEGESGAGDEETEEDACEDEDSGQEGEDYMITQAREDLGVDVGLGETGREG